ncbi:MAG: secretin N-terminal domain-containing protein [Candidatus Zixiibacteriota bacterium]
MKRIDFTKKSLRLIIALVLILIMSTTFSQMTKRYEHLVFQDADIRAIFQFLSKEAGVNIIVNPEVSASVTLDLRNISLQRVIDILLETYDLTMLRENNYYRIMNTTSYRKKQKDDMSYENEKKSLIDIESRIFQIKYATAGELEGPVNSALSDRGEVVIDSRSNSIIVRDIPQQFEKVERLLDDLDQPTKQVKVSAKILLIDKNVMQEIGVQWQANKTSVDDPMGGSNNDVSMGTTTEQVSSNQSIGRFTWGIISGDYAFETAMAALLSDNNSKMIDHPDVTTLDNKPAEIFSGKEIPVTLRDEAGNVIYQYYNVGTMLQITPHITANDKVLLDLYIERNGIDRRSSGIEIIKRTATTSIRIGPDEVAVIGGVSTEEARELEAGVPVLMDIPLLGRLFKYNTKEIVTADLVIFISVDVLD